MLTTATGGSSVIMVDHIPGSISIGYFLESPGTSLWGQSLQYHVVSALVVQYHVVSALAVL